MFLKSRADSHAEGMFPWDNAGGGKNDGISASLANGGDTLCEIELRSVPIGAGVEGEGVVTGPDQASAGDARTAS